MLVVDIRGHAYWERLVVLVLHAENGDAEVPVVVGKRIDRAVASVGLSPCFLECPEGIAEIILRVAQARAPLPVVAERDHIVREIAALVAWVIGPDAGDRHDMVVLRRACMRIAIAVESKLVHVDADGDRAPE